MLRRSNYFDITDTCFFFKNGQCTATFANTVNLKYLYYDDIWWNEKWNLSNYVLNSLYKLTNLTLYNKIKRPAIKYDFYSYGTSNKMN